MQKNSEDGGYRKFILTQLPEECKPDSEAAKAGYKTIDEIGMERIKRAAKKIKAENPLFAGDLGFKHYTWKSLKKTRCYRWRSLTLPQTSSVELLWMTLGWKLFFAHGLWLMVMA